MDLEHTVGLRPDGSVWLPDRRAAAGSILLKLAAMGVEIPAEAAGDEDVFHLAGNLFARYREQAGSWPTTSAPPTGGSSKFPCCPRTHGIVFPPSRAL